MEPSPLDGAAKAFAQTSTRGQALRVLAGGIFGAAVLLGRPGRALAGANDDHDDKSKAKKCNRNTDCPSGQVCLDGACFTGTCTTCGAVNARCGTNVDCCSGLICVNGACFSGTCTSTVGGCTTAATCPQAAPGSCHTASCINGTCGFTNNVAGSACTGGTCDGAGTCVTSQCTSASQCPQAAAGSCQTATCTGGICGFAPDATNLPVCGSCTTATCTGGVPSCVNSAVGTTCNTDGGSVCNGAGQCVQCTTAAQCPQAAVGSCHTATCTNGTCGFTNNAAGSVCTGGTCDGAGNCVTSQCTSASQCPQAALGSCQTATCTGGFCGFAPDNTNLPACGPCTTAVCVNGVPSCVNSAVGTTCNSSGGSVCNGAGQCVQCVTPSNCPGTDTICATRTCTNGTCGFTFAPSTTVCDASGKHCDGAGNCI